MASVILLMNSSATPRVTYTRSAQLQTWPVLITREALIEATARSRSASSRTMAGALPPSSRFTLVTFLLAAAMIADPTGTEPVKLTISTRGSADICSPIAPDPASMLNTPLGSPTSAATFANSKALIGVTDAGLITHVLPVTKAGASLRAMRKNGKFHGRMPTATPRGLRSTKIDSFGRAEFITEPSMRSAKPAM
ncbi:hypothetical protein SDC9_113472 [bioreactor metagenome]|uniref:Uncharacterized protein n=1 Tax=bioreactor metagenome TaxID=1076179 RepID=A0A645BN13_9ZZZZ